MRLDQFVVARTPELSRSKIQKMIEDGAIQVNNRTVSKHVALRANDVVTIEPRIAPVTHEKTIDHTSTLANEPQPVLVPSIIAQTDDYLILDKPAGLLVHPTDLQEPHTLSQWLVAHDPSIATVGDPRRPGIVHRLDREVSGVMVVARTQHMYEHLKHQFKERLVHKEYLALVHGRIPSEEGDITFPIARSTSRAAMAARGKGQEGKPAHTYFEVLHHYANHTYVLAEPKTGRTHQIRVHFFALGYPIVGDRLYTLPAFGRDKLGKNMKRVFLHAARLRFADMSGQEVSYASALPVDLQSTLDAL